MQDQTETPDANDMGNDINFKHTQIGSRLKADISQIFRLVINPSAAQQFDASYQRTPSFVSLVILSMASPCTKRPILESGTLTTLTITAFPVDETN